MNDSVVSIKLTKKQKDALRPLLDEVRKAHQDGKPVMLIGQVWSNLYAAYFGVLTHDQTIQVRAITNPDHAEQMKHGGMPIEV